MKKLTLSILLVLSTFFATYPQSYALQMTNNDLNCYLDMFDSGKYLIKMSYKNAPDLMMSQVLSFGEYNMEDNGDYKLTDGTNEYVITLEPVSGNKVFMVRDGFGWMQMNYFVRSSEKPSSPISILDDFLSREELLSYHKKKKNDTSNFKTGYFQSDLTPGFTFTTTEKGNYNIKFYSLELSTGTWQKVNTFLKLKDNHLNTDFYVMIEPDGKLKSVLMPGDFFLSNFSKVR